MRKKLVTTLIVAILLSFGSFSASAEQLQLSPEFWWSARDDGPRDGVFDRLLGEPNHTQVVINNWLESRHALEFDVAALTGKRIDSGVLNVCIERWGTANQILELHGYDGDGVLELADYAKSHEIESQTASHLGDGLMTFDVSDHVSGIAARGIGHAGYNLRERFAGLNFLMWVVDRCGLPGGPELVIDFSDPTPAELLNELISRVINLNIATGISNSLDAKLENALAALEDAKHNNDHSAVNMLNAFINHVEAQRGQKLTDEQADLLISAAQAIIDKLTA